MGLEPFPSDALKITDIGVTVQAQSAVLDSLQSAPDGLLAKNGATIAGRTITGSSAAQIVVTNGAGAAADPIIGTPQDIDATATPTFGGITTTGGVYRAVTETSASTYVVVSSDHIIIVDASAGEVDIELPSAGAGKREIKVQLMDSSGGGVSFTPDGPDTINGASSFFLSALHESVTLQSGGGSAWYVLGTNSAFIPFAGGTLVPLPGVVLAPLTVNGVGEVGLPLTWPAGLPAGLALYWQTWILDASGPQGLTASNGLVSTTP